MGRLEEEIEAAGSLEEKKTLFSYNSLGQLNKKQHKKLLLAIGIQIKE